jgi:hypothetical protein
MRYFLIKDDMDPNNTTKMYYVLEDNANVVLDIIDENCNSIIPPPAHSIIDENPTLPACIPQP